MDHPAAGHSQIRRALRFLAVLTLACIPIAIPSVLWGETSKDFSEIRGESGLPQTDQDIKEAIDHIQESLSEARQSYRRVKSTMESASPELLGATEDEITQKTRLLHIRTRTYEEHIEAYRTLEKTRLASKDLSDKIEIWKGFAESPPYPISLVDELRDAVHAREIEIKKDEVKQSISQRALDEARGLLETGEQRRRQVQEELEGSTDAIDQMRLTWLHEHFLLESNVARARMLAAETQRQVLEEVLAYHHQDLAFLARKLQVAVANAPFMEEELKKKLDEISEERKVLERELHRAIRSDIRAQDSLEEARGALRQASEKASGEVENFDHLQMLVDERKAWADTTSQTVEGLQLFARWLDAEQLGWQERYRIAATDSETDMHETLKMIDEGRRNTRDLQFDFESRQELTRSLIISQQSRIAVMAPNDKNKPLAKQILAAYQKRDAFIDRVLARISELSRLLDRLGEDMEWQRQEVSVGGRFENIFANVFASARSVWTYELFAAEDTIIIDGQRITERRPVTISKVVRALLILTIGLWFGSVLARSLHALSLRILKTEKNTADLIEKIFRIAVYVCVVFVALVTVKIPFTIFAFLGGALAIGVGFGAQNLINNFISGIIILFERPIKLGDIVEIEGTRGRIVNIGGRCSQVRRFDGIDILVPNSSFLEKNVVNWTLSDEIIRLSVSVGVSYGSPTKEVIRLIGEAADEHGNILEVPESIILFEDFGDNALIFTIYFWTEVSPHADYRIVASDLRHMIDKCFGEAGITIAFPQRDVHLDNPHPIRVKIVESQEPDKPEKKMSD
jgi:small-conductance mechanosensitive channel